MMDIQTSNQLAEKKCVPCEGGVDPCPLPQAQRQLANLPGWRITHDGKRIRKDWVVKDFMAGLRFFEQVARIAEDDGHLATLGREVEPGGMRLGPSHQHVPCPAAADERLAHRERVDEAAALVLHVHGRHAAHAEMPLQECRAAREVDVGRERREQDQVHLVGA